MKLERLVQIDMLPAFDFKNPTPEQYMAVFAERRRRLDLIRSDMRVLRDFKQYYTEHHADFINDWGMTVDPRNLEIGLPAVIPFCLFPKQRQWVEWTLDRWHKRERGLTEKSRDMGISWLAVALADTICLFSDGAAIGFGSRKEEYVDKMGAPKSLFYKARMFMHYLPVEFRGNWDIKKHAPHMRIEFPDTGSVITGEAGDNIGRGDRASIYFVDEAAHLEHPEITEASLSNTTNCRIDMSSVNGTANPFAQIRNSGKVSVFTFHWRDDPRKDQAWYDDMCSKYDPVTIAQEVDINYSASVTGQIIPAAWVQAAIGLHSKLRIELAGEKRSALDIADGGKDKCAQAFRHGVTLTHVESWSGKGSDIFDSVQLAFANCDDRGHKSFDYDADGLGAGTKGDARVINEARKKEKRPVLVVEPFRGSGEVFKPEEFVKGPDGKSLDRRNKDMYTNYKAQSWWHLRFLFLQAYRAMQGLPYDRDNIISIDPSIPELSRLIVELSQPVYKLNTAGKILVDKQPEGVASPNLADAVMMVYAPRRSAMKIADSLLGTTHA